MGKIEEVLGLDPGTINVPIQCNESMAGALEPSGVICPGYIISLKAIKRFAFEHGGELIPVRPGIDIASHHNIINSYAPVTIATEP